MLAMVVSLFETGYLPTGAALFEYSPGHLSESGMAVRVADAMLRGARRRGSIDFLRTDWFELARLPVVEVRDLFEVTPKSARSVAAGSVGPRESGGISSFQADAGQAAAPAAGRPYDSFGASVAPEASGTA